MADNTDNTVDQNVSAIDKAIAAAQARKANKNAGSDAPTTTPKATRAKMTDEEKAAKLAAREADREARKVAREAARAEKRAAAEASRKPAHMKKVEKAGERLSELTDTAQIIFNEATANLSAADLANLATHIQYFNRVKATERALAQKLEVGQTVNIVSGDPRFIGKSGTLAKVQRIRCYVTVEGFNKPIYLFTSDVELAAVTQTEDVAAATG